MTDMAIGEKYAPLGNWLKEHGGDSVKLTFDELNQIIPIPNHAYKNRPSWANLSNPASFCSSWISAGYVVDSISLEEQWVVFRKGEVQGHTHHSILPYHNISYVLTQQDADAIEWHCKRLGFKQCRIVATTVNGEEFKENIDVSWIHMRTSLWEKT